MKNDGQPVETIAKFIEKDFIVSEDNSLIPATENVSLEEFRKYLIEKLKHLLDEKFDMLVNILYRIDVSEEKLSMLFSEKNKDSIPPALADLIIERQLQKISMRKSYKDGNI